MRIMIPGTGAVPALNASFENTGNAGTVPTTPQFDNFFNGNLETGTMAYDPYVSGYSLVRWLSLPGFLTTAFPGFQSFTERNFLTFGGLSSIDLQVTGQQVGFSGNEIQNPTSMPKGNNEFTLAHQEYSGLPITKAYSYWTSAIRDPETGIATYPSLPGAGGVGMQFYSGALLYCTLKPSAAKSPGGTGGAADGTDNRWVLDPAALEFAAIYTCVFPKRIPLDHVGSHEAGTHDLQRIEIPFAGYLHLGESVMKLAASYLMPTTGTPMGSSFYKFRLEDDFLTAPNNNTLYPVTPVGD